MDRIRRRFAKINYFTLLKYFLSYFFLLSFLLLCFFFVFRKQLKTAYYTARDDSVQEKLVLFQENFNRDLDYVFNIHYNLCNNTNLKMLRNKPESTWYASQGIGDMREFVSANPLVSDVVYIQKQDGRILACKNYAYESKGEYYLLLNKKALKIPVGTYGHDNQNSMVFLQRKEQSVLLLFPYVASNKYDLFYVIDYQEIISRFQNTLSEEMVSVYLTDEKDQVIAQTGDQMTLPTFQRFSNSGLQKREGAQEVIYTIMLYSNLYLTVCVSKDALLQYANRAFLDMYLVLAAIGGIGFLLILFGMKLTYSPLHKLGKKFVEISGDYKGLESQLDVVFSSALKEQKKLQEKIDQYHNLMKESVLDTIVNKNGEEITSENMERLLNGEPGSLLFVLKIETSGQGEGLPFVTRNFQKFFQKTFPNHDSFSIRLEITPDYGTYLIYYGGQDQDKYNVLFYLVHDFLKDTGCKLTMSNGSSSPLDIPVLYAAVTQSDQTFFYPNQELGSFASFLNQLKWEEAKQAIREFFQSLDQTAFPAFYSRSVLTEVLTTIITSMNQQNIKFTAYNNTYFEALYFIRSFSYQEKRKEICEHFLILIDQFEHELSNLTIQSTQLQDFMNESYTSSELSIALVANKYHVSIAYISYLFKKYFNETFTDYLWNLRVAKAKSLLTDTNRPMEEICIEVGYENVASFRRKFKKEVGMTPSRYREERGNGSI